MALAMEEGERKKRKITIEAEEEDEDVKMEKFFALIRSTQDIRDRLLESEESRQQRKMAVERENIRRWRPPIPVPQDLEENHQKRKIALIGANRQDTCACAKRSEEEDDNNKADDDDGDEDDNDEKNHHHQGRRYAYEEDHQVSEWASAEVLNIAVGILFDIYMQPCISQLQAPNPPL
ncbi:hypothetical protein Cgig2_030176 [Carnegiea gigantea]|uniref:Uncharacterized protein n=1 Tax=Carnegiea gigantea TaxID=171969 RepID=A0A9Q1K8E3_9CARY|nr:hypothetical protein Cgig2_030176 [Carnegiea gigantea]